MVDINTIKAGDRVKIAPHIAAIRRCGGLRCPESMSPYWGTHAMPVKEVQNGQIFIQLSGISHEYYAQELVMVDSY